MSERPTATEVVAALDKHPGLRDEVLHLLTDGFAGPWPESIPPRHLCLWLREFASHDLTVQAWANAIEAQFAGTPAWDT